MLSKKSILIVDPNAYIALDLASAVELLGGQVGGPVGTADAALAHLAANRVDGAVLDADMIGAAAIAASLRNSAIPFVVQGGTILPTALRRLCDPSAILARPVDSTMVLSLLAIEIGKIEQRRVETMIIPESGR